MNLSQTIPEQETQCPTIIIARKMSKLFGKKYLICIFAICQLKLTNIDAVSLLDKRGYLTICINQKTDGRVYLRLQEGIRDWFYHIQTTVYESKRRRKFWVKGPTLAGPGVAGGNNRLARLYGENGV